MSRDSNIELWKIYHITKIPTIIRTIAEPVQRDLSPTLKDDR